MGIDGDDQQERGDGGAQSVDQGVAPGQPLTAQAKTSRVSPILLIGATVVVIGLLAGVVVGLLVGRPSPKNRPERPVEVATDAGVDPSPETTTLQTTSSITSRPPVTAPATTEAPTTTAPPLPSIRSFDFENWDYEIDCDSTGIRTIPVRDGSWVRSEGPTYGVVDGMSIEYGDADGDGVEDALITIVCSVGVSTWWPNTIVMTPVPGGAEPIGQPIIASTEFRNGEIVGRVPRHGPDDARCCPSEFLESVWRLRNGGWNEEETRVVPAPPP